jgi:site-specific recombinase XerD
MTIPATRPSAVTTREELAERAAGYVEGAKSANTRRAYEGDIAHFRAWCEANRFSAVPTVPGTLAAYLTAHAGLLKTSTLARRMVAIRQANREAGNEMQMTPKLADLWKGIRRAHATRPDRKRALVITELRKVVQALPASPLGDRDRALLLIGYAGALRRSELVALSVDGSGEHHVMEVPDGLLIRLGRAKADQEAAGTLIAIPFGSHAETCPVRAYRAWRASGAIETGMLFRSIDRHGGIGESLSDKAVALIVKRAIEDAAKAEGWSQEKAEELAAGYAGHSLRAGLATSASSLGAPGHLVQRHMRHAKYETTVAYIREGEAFRENVAAMAGL